MCSIEILPQIILLIYDSVDPNQHKTIMWHHWHIVMITFQLPEDFIPKFGFMLVNISLNPSILQNGNQLVNHRQHQEEPPTTPRNNHHPWNHQPRAAAPPPRMPPRMAPSHNCYHHITTGTVVWGIMWIKWCNIWCVQSVTSTRTSTIQRQINVTTRRFLFPGI